MKKIRIEMTCVLELEPSPEYYPKGSTIQDRLNLELENLDVVDIVEDSRTVITIVGKIVEDI
jgi:hypothetical protein